MSEGQQVNRMSAPTSNRGRPTWPRWRIGWWRRRRVRGRPARRRGRHMAGGINWIALLGNIDKVRSVIVAVLNALHDQGLLKDQPES
jgi:hypothetical protein